MSDAFPEEIRQFLAEHISSVAQLEVLLLLRGEPDRAWTADEVSTALATTSEMATEQLSDLQNRGLVASTAGNSPAWQYKPATAELDERVGRLDQTYNERRVAVITVIYSQPLDKVRTFADAFRLRKDN